MLCPATAVCLNASLLVSRLTYLTFGIDLLRIFSFDLMGDVRKTWDISVDLC